ncbi:hypothetical protein [Mucilaginibacter lacusdianchii]|uniref:hypothetical protein n=1 Tax=Mucilaginibacter lacusdianchii TaxID=2684211 RepID=UPI00131BE286|nr:hypothetical protein [Mucilaginibacter sp. JXJ CY 39]
MLRLNPYQDNGETSISFNTRASATDCYNLWMIGAGAWGTRNKFVIGSSANNAPLMTFIPNGNVGIGTTSPDTKLQYKALFIHKR